MPRILLVLLSTTSLLRAQGSFRQETQDEAAAFHRPQGDRLIEEGNLRAALVEFQTARAFGMGRDVEVLKHLAAVHIWMRQYGQARELLGRVLTLGPGDNLMASAHWDSLRAAVDPASGHTR